MGLSATEQFQIGSLVRVRERDWVVLPSDDPEILKLRPLSGSEAEACGILKALEGSGIQHAEFPEPNPERAGDFIAGRLLRDAARLSLRSGAGPFRSLGRLSVRPRPYQFVPLIMALRLDPVRLLIADDVGVGKTIEGALIARELLDRGDAQRICVLCPPHLCDQWRRALELKFNLQPVVVRTSTVAGLERDLPRRDLSIYKHYPHLVCSIDFVKSERHRPDFLHNCPDLVIVDEAHSVAQPGGRASREQQQRHELVREIAHQANRHLLLLTATPHSGIEESFLSLLGLLNPRFERLSLQNLEERDRAALARHLVQRRRADVEKWLGTETSFPKRDPIEETYPLAKEYRKLFDDVLAFTRETVQEPGLTRPRQRVRYWAALSLLRCLMSSPRAAQVALSTKAPEQTAPVEEPEEEDVRPREILDPLEETTLDSVPEAAVEAGEGDLSDRDRRRLGEFRRRAEAIVESGDDAKIAKAAEVVAGLLRKGCRPIVYCRFIATADYVTEQLAKRLQPQFPDIHTLSVTGETGNDEEREARVAELAESPRRVLVATDCLSEGIDLQDSFNAVVHYDLPWNPNRLEQREGRVDRFGQTASVVPAVLLYGADNPIDGVVLKVLIRKARQIYRTLGISVPVPVNSESVVQAVIKALFESRPAEQQLQLGFDEFVNVDAIHEAWDRAAEREKASRTRFAQHAIKPDEVAKELEVSDNVLGDPEAVRGFMLEAAARLQFSFQRKNGHFVLDLANLPEHVAERLGWKKPQKVVFDSPPPKGLEDAVVLVRNHPLVVALCDRILGDAFRPEPDHKFARSGAAQTAAVTRRTVVALLRIRYRLKERRGAELFAEEIVTASFRRSGDQLEWLTTNGEEIIRLLKEPATWNGSQQERVQQVEWAVRTLRFAGDDLDKIAEARARELEESHARLRQYVGGQQVKVKPYRPDVLAVYVLVPGGGR
jgi:superfamily II DNA or RNA helicase